MADYFVCPAEDGTAFLDPNITQGDIECPWESVNFFLDNNTGNLIKVSAKDKKTKVAHLETPESVLGLLDIRGCSKSYLIVCEKSIYHLEYDVCTKNVEIFRVGKRKPVTYFPGFGSVWFSQEDGVITMSIYKTRRSKKTCKIAFELTRATPPYSTCRELVHTSGHESLRPLKSGDRCSLPIPIDVVNPKLVSVIPRLTCDTLNMEGVSEDGEKRLFEVEIFYFRGEKLWYYRLFDGHHGEQVVSNYPQAVMLEPIVISGKSQEPYHRGLAKVAQKPFVKPAKSARK